MRDGTSHSGAAHVAFDAYDRLGLRDVIDLEAQSHTPADCCVRFAVAVTDAYATLATGRPATAIAILAAYPLRHRNLAGLTLNRTLVRREGAWWVQIPAAETKTKEVIEGPLPRADGLHRLFELLPTAGRQGNRRGHFRGAFCVSLRGTQMI